MKKFFASAVLGFLFLAASAFAQVGLADIQKEIREQEAKLATVSLMMLQYDITAAVGRTIRASKEFLRLEKKIQKLSGDHPTACAQLPTLPYRQVLREAQTSAALVVELMGRAAPLIAAGGMPSEGMRKLIEGDMPQIMRTIAADGAKLQSLFSDLETSCAKEG